MRKQSPHQESRLVLEMRKPVPVLQHCWEAGTSHGKKENACLEETVSLGTGTLEGTQGLWLLQKTEWQPGNAGWQAPREAHTEPVKAGAAGTAAPTEPEKLAAKLG